MTTMPSSVTTRVLRAGCTAAIAATLAGCTLDATNPGPIQAAALDNPGALNSLVAGAGRDLSEACLLYTSPSPRD